MLHRLAFATFLTVSFFSSHAAAETRSLVVAGGCFWCVEKDFEHVNGVIEAESGYAGGQMKNPTYTNHGNHREVVKITYDSTVVDYQTLVSTFLRTIDVFDPDGQFCDRGRSYAPAVHYGNDAEMKAAQAAFAEAETTLGRPLVVPLESKPQFWLAEAYHQDYYKSEQLRLTRFGPLSRADAYKRYRKACGRDQRVREIWGNEAYTNVNYPAG